MKISNGYVVYKGPSRIDGRPIVVIATGLTKNSSNVKTGSMVQMYILNSRIAPIEAIYKGKTKAICGDCPLKKRIIKNKMIGACYVNIGQGPLAVYRAFKRGIYPVLTDYNVFAGKFIRFGAYGDPTALPVEVLEQIANVASGWTGYTHRWSIPENKAYKKFCVASTDSIDTFEKAKKLGWQSFRHATSAVDTLQSGETVCLAESISMLCKDCRLCNGRNKDQHVVITRHGACAKHTKGD